jgi:hypothetical protein
VGLLLSLACAGSGPTPADSVDSEPPLTHQFSFAVLADPHVGNSDDGHEQRLQEAVAWINANANAERIELVWILGDIGWGEGLPRARLALDELEPTWLPVLGDNEIHIDSEPEFDQIFGDHYETLAGRLESWDKGAVEVHNTTYDVTSWMQNFSFDYGGLHWVGLDWNSRSDNSLLGELGELNDFEDGTLPFFQNDLGVFEASEGEDILLFSHHPMHIGAFNDAQMAEITGTTSPLAGRVAGAYAGHLHLNAEVQVEEGGYVVWVTDATWDDENTVRLVRVFGNGVRHEYEQELVVLP